MPRPRTTPLSAMRASLELSKARVTEIEKELANAKLDVTQFERCVTILEQQQPTPTLIPASKGKTA